ncbi:hypothetical protein E2C01_047421 [Portunus trituberculatus]|uniref:Uncharacterized protein n=1 Tax=Portunus trituberculatus TaxID=210409 RepID=A0A5B7G7V1_PORTR|nr:hypothetical protein [Portunus trituberculatus]
MIKSYPEKSSRRGQMSSHLPLKRSQVVGRWKYRSRRGVPEFTRERYE